MEKPQTSLIIDITEIFQHKQRKEKELEFYRKELEKLQFKMYMVSQEIKVTETIIGMIETEKVVDLVEQMKKNYNGPNLQ
jgi:hydroxymethylpyrimidine/phosphomethylpyrimidine kinase